jgi:hypothetical protein
MQTYGISFASWLTAAASTGQLHVSDRVHDITPDQFGRLSQCVDFLCKLARAHRQSSSSMFLAIETFITFITTDLGLLDRHDADLGLSINASLLLASKFVEDRTTCVTPRCLFNSIETRAALVKREREIFPHFHASVGFWPVCELLCGALHEHELATLDRIASCMYIACTPFILARRGCPLDCAAVACLILADVLGLPFAMIDAHVEVSETLWETTRELLEVILFAHVPLDRYHECCP